MARTGWRNWFRRTRLTDDEVIWALDLETSGLQASRDRILAVGMVPIRGGVIRYGERYETLVQPPHGETLSTEGLRAHHLLPADLADAPPVAVVLPEVDRRLREGTLLLHHARLDLGFLREAYRRAGRRWPAPRVVDTVDLLLRLHRRVHHFTPHPPTLRTSLGEARAQLGLPSYTAHDALSDALATAELFLLLRARLELC